MCSRDQRGQARGGAIAWPVATNAQQAGRLPTIGFLGANPAGFAPWAAAFVARLRELGWVDGHTQLQSSIDGRKGAPSGTRKLRQSSRTRKWTLLLLLEVPFPRWGKRRVSSQSYLPLRSTLCVAGLSAVWPIRAAM